MTREAVCGKVRAELAVVSRLVRHDVRLGGDVRLQDGRDVLRFQAIDHHGALTAGRAIDDRDAIGLGVDHLLRHALHGDAAEHQQRHQQRADHKCFGADGSEILAAGDG